MTAPPGFRFLDGLGWCRVDAEGNVLGKPEGAGRWTQFPSGRWVFEPAVPEEQMATNINVRVAEKLPPAQVAFIGLKVQFPDKSLRDLAAILADMFPTEQPPISYAAVRKWNERHKARNIITKPANTVKATTSKFRIRVISADSPMITAEGDVLQGVEDLEQLRQSAKSGKPSDKKALSRFVSVQRTSPQDADELDDATVPELAPGRRKRR